MSDDELKLTRRLFLRHSAAVTVVSAGAFGIALKTDALSQQAAMRSANGRDLGDAGPYPYFEPQ